MSDPIRDLFSEIVHHAVLRTHGKLFSAAHAQYKAMERVIGAVREWRTYNCLCASIENNQIAYTCDCLRCNLIRVFDECEQYLREDKMSDVKE